jgi:IclR family acetate operon transcriptional repressor
MERLAADAGETANLGVLDGGRVVNLHKVLGPHPVRLHIDAVGGVPAHATALGKVLLADLPADELDRRLGSRPLVRLTSKTIGDRAVLRAELARVGQRGYAVDDEECSPGLRCVAAPVRDRLGAVVAAVSVSGPARRLPRQRLVGLGSAVRAAALAISRRLGFEPAPAAAGRAAGRSHVRPTPAPPARRRSA